MEGDPDVPENARETDNLVTEEGSYEKASSETSTLLSEMPGHSVSRGDEADSSSKPHPHPYHLKNKYTFRSDSVYSDVVPMSHHSNNKASEPREKSGSLSSLKAKESKWMTLKKKLGKLNSHSHSLSQTSSSEKPIKEKEKDRPPAKSIHEKRSLFQRAKTLSIMPVHKTSKEKEETPHHKRVEEPPELFNVGGEMNLIPLELLINVNDLDLRK